MVVAKSEVAYTHLKRPSATARCGRSLPTRWFRVTRSAPGTIAPIGRHPGHEWKMAVRRGGRHSVTHYKTLQVFRSATLLEIELETGRTHQIRVHMAAINHPCIGDPLYGADPALASRLGLDRQWLHATELGFVHPTRGENVSFRSPYPEDLASSLAQVEAEG